MFSAQLKVYDNNPIVKGVKAFGIVLLDIFII